MACIICQHTLGKAFHIILCRFGQQSLELEMFCFLFVIDAHLQNSSDKCSYRLNLLTCTSQIHNNPYFFTFHITETFTIFISFKNDRQAVHHKPYTVYNDVFSMQLNHIFRYMSLCYMIPRTIKF